MKACSVGAKLATEEELRIALEKAFVIAVMSL